MVKKVHYTWKDIEHMVMSINNLMFADNWRPDYIVGLTRGGLVPAVIMSNMTGILCHTLDVRFRDTDENYSGPESNCWMAEDAFGYEKDPKNILIIDDINRGGDAMSWIMRDWQSSCLPSNERWDHVWHDNVRFASLLSSPNSIVDTDYWSQEFSDDEETWIQFPWET